MIAARSVTVQFAHERKGATRGDAQTRASAPPSSRAAEGSRPGPILFRPPGFGYDALAPERGVRIRTRARLSPRSGAGYLAAETHGSAPWAIIFRPPGSVRSARSAACGLPRCAEYAVCGLPVRGAGNLARSRLFKDGFSRGARVFGAAVAG